LRATIKPLIQKALFLLLISLAGASYAQIPQIEREALVALYNSTDGTNWKDNTGWLGDAGTECGWYGVTCSSASVTRVLLDDNLLTGTIPSELGNLSNLTYLNLRSNELSGNIPSELGSLTKLTYFYLNSNSLSGTIPSELGNLTKLTQLYLGNNSLTGSIPSELGNLTNLTYLYLGFNSHSGTIPTELGNLSNLIYLSFQNNSLSGTIPSEVINLPKLTTSIFDGNLFAGSGFSISATERDALIALYNSTDGANWVNNTGWLGEAGTECNWHGVKCTSAKVTSLILSSNSLKGAIPSELGNLTNLTVLDLSINSLSGSIPSELGNLTNLTSLYLVNNSLSGAIPNELGNLTSLRSLNLGLNSLSGNIPAELGNLSNLTWLNLQLNSLTGTIPSEFGNLTKLTNLNLAAHKPTGGIPSELGKLTNLEKITLGLGVYNESYYEGIPPVSLKNLTSLTVSNLGKLPFLGDDTDNDGIADRNDENPKVKAEYKEIVTSDYSLIFSPSSRVVNYVPNKDTFEQWLLAKGEAVSNRDQDLTNIIYEHFGDEFDFIIAAPNIYASCIAYSSSVKLAADGIGRDPSIFTDRTSEYGSKGRLQNFIYFNNAQYIKSGPSLHEIMHAWAAPPPFNHEGRGGHWGNSNIGGQLGGWKPNSLKELDDGTYQVETTYNGIIAGAGWADNILPYSNFELYLMGLIGPDEVGQDLIQANDLEWIDYDKDIFSASSLTTTTMDQFIEKNGARNPSHLESQKEFEALYVVISEKPLTLEEWNVYDDNVSGFQAKENDGNKFNYNFWEATQGKASISFSQTDHILSSSLAVATGIPTPLKTTPSVEISGVGQVISDTDNSPGESVTLTATATDNDGTISKTQWLINGSEVATTFNATFLLPNGSTTVTFKATDNDGKSSITTATITVEAPVYTPTKEWPSPYNGVTPDTSLGLAFNNIGIFNSSDATIYACLRLFANGLASSSNGISQFDIGLKVVSLADATVQIVKSREFNTIGALNEKVQAPDCSGIFETTTSLYTDIIQANSSVLETVWSLIDPTNLILKLISSKELTAN